MEVLDINRKAYCLFQLTSNCPCLSTERQRVSIRTVCGMQAVEVEIFLAGSQGPGGTRMRNRIHPVWV